MFKSLVRSVAAVVCASTALAAGESQACWFSHCFKPQQTTFYAAPACNVCPQQVSYVPQTCYRTVYSCVPCTTYRPVTSCDPCTGCPQTVMQPVTTYVRRPVVVPYTTYRPVATSVGYATGAAYTSPYYTGAQMAAPSGCSTCGTGASVTYGAPAATYGTPMQMAPGTPMQMAPPSLTTPPMGTTPPSMGTPTPAVPNGSTPPSTFGPNGTTPPPGSSSMYPTQPIPDVNPALNSSGAPRLLDPQNRTTARPMMGPASVTPAIFRTADRAIVFQPAVTSTPKQNARQGQTENASDGWNAPPKFDDGWRPTESR